AWWLRVRIKKRNDIKLKEKFFKRNGGLLLQQQLTSSEGTVDRCKIFSAKELDKATDHLNVNIVLGQGGQGTVHKGMLADERIVAVKKSKVVDKGKLDEFINKVVILSQINYRNVVKLLGCCLETEVPLLVYEYIPNGNLSDYLHEQNEDFVKDVGFILSRRGGITQLKRKKKKNKIWKQQMLKGLALKRKKFEKEKWRHTVLKRKENKY
ncbi:hypothetical protein CICLE_v10030230mg, partial [Citrus x clementina]